MKVMKTKIVDGKLIIDATASEQMALENINTAVNKIHSASNSINKSIRQLEDVPSNVKLTSGAKILEKAARELTQGMLLTQRDSKLK